MTNENLIKELIDDGYLKSPSIIKAFRKIDRLNFIPGIYKDEAYGNYPLSIGRNQTISQPLTVAFMLELLEPKAGEKILDVGCGSGWQTALLAEIIGDPAVAGGMVIGIERINELKNLAENNILKFGFIEKGIVKIIEGDGTKGYEADAPYDKIIAAAAGEIIPKAWKEQLKIGGRIVAPVKESIIILDKLSPSDFSQRQYFGFSFVPLVEGK
ncbi:MAG: protein-L-isoaspartate O-methyltransferase [Patescibacteria group bacterium]